MTSNSKHVRRPTLACEIAADRVLAGRAADAGRMVEMASARELAPGTVVPDLMEANLRDGTAVRRAVGRGVGGVGRGAPGGVRVLAGTPGAGLWSGFGNVPLEAGRAEAGGRPPA